MQLSAQDLSQSSAVTQFLRFSLSSDMKLLLPVKQLAAVLKIEITKITPIPHLPTWVMGVYNWRGEILWILDTAHLLGISSWQQQPISTAYEILLLEDLTVEASERRYLGLWVRQVGGIELLSLNDIQSSSTVYDGVVPFLRGHWLNPSGDVLSLLDGAAIFNRMPA
ncbi:MAG: chemotaxis protein CheW [Leptolyngbyaceae cyanobacterium]